MCMFADDFRFVVWDWWFDDICVFSNYKGGCFGLLEGVAVGFGILSYW